MRLVEVLVVLFLLILPGLCRAELQQLAIREVAPGVYVHQGVHQVPDSRNRGEIANIGFIVGARCVAVVDTGGSPEQGEALKQAIAVTTPVPVCYVINTHVHPDHIFGNLAFKQPGVSFVGHYKLEQAMAMRAPYYADKAVRDLGFTLKPEHFIPPNQSVRDTLELDLGGRTLLLTAHPTAHTDNDLSVYDRGTRTLWLADLLFMGHLPVVDGSLNGWLKEIEKLRTMEVSLVVPGHGPVSAAWPLALVSEERYLRMLQTEIRAAQKGGKTMEQAMAEVGLSARGEWQLFEEFHKKNIATSYVELEWEGD